MAEEDIIFGKNRHLYGGIEPSNMKTFSTIATYDGGTDTNKVTITAVLPTDTFVNGQLLCTVAGAVIRRSTTDYPKDEFDGDLVANITYDQTIVDTDVINGQTYYYSAFPYTDQGVYNRSDANRDETTTFVVDYLYGYDLNTTDSDPSTRVTYPSDVQNHLYSSAGMDYDAEIFNYGGWTITAGSKFMPKPCVLNYDGVVEYYLDPNDYSKKEDGTASDITNRSLEINAMMEWPKIYTKRWEENGIYHFRCSDVKLDDGYECWCNYDRNDNEIDHFYTAIYDGERSLSSNNIKNEAHTTYQEADRLQVRYLFGIDWDIETLSDRLLIQDLLVMMSKTTDGQTAFGKGRNSAVSTTGGLNNKGLFWGSSIVGNSVKVFGMEDWYGGSTRRIEGMCVYGGELYCKFTRGTKDGSSTTDYTLANYTGYLKMGSVTGLYNYISGCKTTTFGRIPFVTSGSSTTYECDYCIYGTSASSGYYVSNYYAGEYTNGPFSVGSLRSISSTSNKLALSCKPSAT